MPFRRSRRKSLCKRHAVAPFVFHLALALAGHEVFGVDCTVEGILPEDQIATAGVDCNGNGIHDECDRSLTDDQVVRRPALRVKRAQIAQPVHVGAMHKDDQPGSALRAVALRHLEEVMHSLWRP